MMLLMSRGWLRHRLVGRLGEAQKKILGALNSFAKAREGDLHDAGK